MRFMCIHSHRFSYIQWLCIYIDKIHILTHTQTYGWITKVSWFATVPFFQDLPMLVTTIFRWGCDYNMSNMFRLKGCLVRSSIPMLEESWNSQKISMPFLIGLLRNKRLSHLTSHWAAFAHLSQEQPSVSFPKHRSSQDVGRRPFQPRGKLSTSKSWRICLKDIGWELWKACKSFESS